MNSTRVGIVLVLLASCFPETALGGDVVRAVSNTKTQAKVISDKMVFAKPTTESLLSDCQAEYKDDCFGSVCNNPCPRVYVQVGALFMQQVSQFNPSQPIVVDPNAGSTFISTSDINTIFSPGMQATAGLRLNSGRTVELDYFGLFGGSTTATAVKPAPGAFLIFPNNLAGNVFVDMENTNVNYSSHINSFALNLPYGNSNPVACDACDACACDAGGCDAYQFGRSKCQSFTWFSGFRYLNVNQRLDIVAQRVVANAVEQGSYNVRTQNNLFGGQLGARFRRTSGRLGWDATGFAGIFGNAAQQTQSVTDFPNFALRPSVTDSKGGVAFVGGGNLSGLYSLTKVLNLRAGYNTIWIEGLALAPDQLDFNLAAAQAGSSINNNGGMFLHGANVGLEARW